MPASSADIADRILLAVVARKLAPGERLGEVQLAALFGCSRTIVREALMRLAARGLVTVSARRGWFLAEPTEQDAREAFEARHVIETGLLRRLQRVPPGAVKALREHLRRQQEAVAGPDASLRAFLLGDFHVCLARCLGNELLADTLRDYTARTALVAMRYQTPRDAARSCAEHARIVRALETGDIAKAERLLAEHLDTWDDKLRVPEHAAGPLDRLRVALAPVHATAARDLHDHASPARRTRGKPS